MCAEVKRYSQSEDDYLRSNYRSTPSRVLASCIGRSQHSVSDRLRVLGLQKSRMRSFSSEEDEIIRDRFGENSVDVARQLGRAPSVIRTRAIKLGLGKWKRELKEFRGYRISKIERGDGSLARRVPEHRDVMGKHLGRELGDYEVVHHINCKKRDNGIENLYLCADGAAHLKAHYSINGLVADLLERGVIMFDRAEGIYKLCETSK